MKYLLGFALTSSTILFIVFIFCAAFMFYGLLLASLLLTKKERVHEKVLQGFKFFVYLSNQLVENGFNN